MNNKAEKINQILNRVLKKSHLHKIKETGIKMGWEGLVGKEVAKHTAPGFLKKGVLFVHVDSSTWAYELSTHLKEIMLSKINAGIGEEVVRDIHFKVGEFRR